MTETRQNIFRPLMAILWLALGVSAAMVLPLAFADTARAQTATQIDLLVMDSATQKPLPDAMVIPAFNNRKQAAQFTGPDGHLVIPLPAEGWQFLVLHVSSDGWTAKRITWIARRIPSTYTVMLDPGNKISGKVVDDNGVPISGADVVIRFDDALQNPNEALETNITVVTGQDGIWTYTGAPQSMNQVEIGAWDYGYITGSTYNPEVVPAAKLLNGSDTLTLHNGITVVGTVLDSDSKPIRKARITLGPGRFGGPTVPPERTDRTGGFSFAAAPGQQVVVTVLANGYAPELQSFVMGQQSPPALTFNLQLARDITGTVIDSHGRPIPRANIYFQTWRGFQTIANGVQADQNGRFDWPNAPVDTVYAIVNAQGYNDAQNVAMTPDHPVVVTLQQAQHVHVLVVDANTDKPIEKFIQFTIGGAPQSESKINWIWPENQMRTYPGGTFDLFSPYGENNNNPGYGVTIEANGYLSASANVNPSSASDAPLVMKLTPAPAKDITAAAFDPDGKPAAGAQAYLVFADGQPLNNFINVENLSAPNNQQYYGEYSPVIASGTGNLALPPQIGPFKILIFDPSGFALVNQDDLNKSSSIQLQPWGAIKGRLVLGTDSAAEQSIQLIPDMQDPNSQINRSFSYGGIKTDENGQFEIDHVPPGKWLVCLLIIRQIQMPYGNAEQTLPTYPQQTVQIKSGQTTDLTLGGMGRTVLGHVIPPSNLTLQSGTYSFYGQMMAMGNEMMPQLPIPADVKNGSAEKEYQWWMTFYNSAAGKAYIATMNNYYQHFNNNSAINIGPDGVFIVHGVLPGTYNISVQIQNANRTVFVYGQAQFTMPAIPGGVSDEVLVVPPIRLQNTVVNGPGQSLNPGDVAPDFSLKTLVGAPLNLSDFHGKYILLYVWGSWNPRSTSQTAAIKALYNTLSSDSRFVMIGLDVDDTPQPARDFVAKNGLSWLQGYVGPWIQKKTPILDEYKVGYLPWYCLIGPDGRVINTAYDINRIQTVAERALQQ
jgi:AhpC/TSA family/Carboxypeptidase regulatory-like domain